MTRIAFVCVENAGRSQMAAAYAERMATERGLDVEIVMGGTEPAREIHPVVTEVMLEDGVDVRDRTPRKITPDDLSDADVVVTMGCSVEDVCPAAWSGESRDWGLPDPAGASVGQAMEIRDEVERRVLGLFDELVDDGMC